MGATRRNFGILVRITSLLLLLTGITGLGGSFLLHKYQVYYPFFINFYVILPALLAVVSGAVLVISGCFGSQMSTKQPGYVHGVFAYLLIIVFCVVATTATLAYNHQQKLDVDLGPLKDVFEKYSDDIQDAETKAVDALQSELQCCGVQSYTDWLKIPWYNHTRKNEVPLTCCNTAFQSCNGTTEAPTLLYTDGCQNKLKEKLQLAVDITMLMSLVVAFLLVTSWFATAQLMKQPPPLEYQALDQDFVAS